MPTTIKEAIAKFEAEKTCVAAESEKVCVSSSSTRSAVLQLAKHHTFRRFIIQTRPVLSSTSESTDDFTPRTLPV